MKRRQILASLSTVLGIVLGTGAWADDKPNILLILADDLGWNAVGYHNPEVQTPNIDSLCSQGIELDNFYVSPMCSPTRAGLMTGRYPIRYGCARAVIPPWRDFGLPVTEVTMAEALAGAGYGRRGIFGKWHLGHAREKWLPNRRGFTDFVGCYNGSIDYYTHEREGELDWHRDLESDRREGYATTLTGEAAAEFIRRAVRERTPFFCYVAFNAPHSPFQAPEDSLDKYRHVEDVRKRTYHAMISAMDDEIGRLLRTLEDVGAVEDTLVWFASDNGGVAAIEENNAPLRGAKLSAFEGGIRSVSCVRYPAGYPGSRKITERLAFIDVLPTLLSLADMTPEEAGCKPLDGVDLNPLLTGRTNRVAERDLYFYHGQAGEQSEHAAVISGPWKLMVNGPNLTHGLADTHRIRLFRIAEDPNETTNVVQPYPEAVDALTRKLIAFRRLQPETGVPPYDVGREGFVAPVDWRITVD